MFATEREVKELRDRALAWEANGFPQGDDFIKPIVSYFNQRPEVACVMSCEGHDWNEHRFHILFAVTEAGFPLMQEFYTRLRNRMVMHGLKSRGSLTFNSCKLSFTTRTWPTQDVGGEIYDAMIISAIAGEDERERKKIFFTHLYEILTELPK